jgi:hypothetical protein
VSDGFLEDVKRLLSASGIASDNLAVRPCREGGNNLVFEIALPERRLIAKQYYRSEHDLRDRLGAEWSFLAYARELGLDSVPAPIARDAGRGLALYEFVDGRKLGAGELNAAHVLAAASFFRELNGENRFDLAASLPDASEACFSVARHIETVEGRVRRLGMIEAKDDLTSAAVKLADRLAVRWRDIRVHIANAAGFLPCGLEGEIPSRQRCVSPSDFGFHNALLKPDGNICFIDFEYSGWDDPAKMAADFFCQPQVPIDMNRFEDFIDRAMAFSPDDSELKARSRLLLPALRVKWLCIMLNDFLPDAARRRRFANPEADADVRKRTQLDMSARALEALEG